MANASTYTNSKLEQAISRSQSHSWVDLSDQQVTDLDIDNITQQAIIKKKCLGLNLRYNGITPVGAEILADALKNNTSLQMLYLSYNRLSDRGVQYLASELSTNNSTLVELQLEHNGITDTGVQYLSEMLKNNRSLVHLGLAGNEIGDQGIQLLSDALTQHNTRLEVLNIRENASVTDKSVESLVDMIKHSRSLNKLSVSLCSLSKASIAQLRQASKEKHSFILGAD
jgi:Ran GTPase-activating protein (RanGAP) involved in mRNA processing and transport